MSDAGWSFSKVKDVKETKKQGTTVRKFLVEWNPTYSTAKELFKTEKELFDLYVTFKVLGPINSPANKNKTDIKDMIWGVEKTRMVDKTSEIFEVPFSEVRSDYPEELADYLLQFATI